MQASGAETIEQPATGASGPGRRRSFAMSIDTGGTFTDGFVSDGEHTAQVKVATTPQDLTIGFQACLEAAAAAVGADVTAFLGGLGRIHFSSTVATNTIVERRGARVGLIVTRGAEKDLYGAPEHTSVLSALLDPELVRGVPEDVDTSGRVIAEPTEADIDGAVRELLERGVGLLVVSFANAHLNQANELLARDMIGRSYPRHYLGAVPLMVASRVSLERNNHGRTATAVINAYLHPNLVRALYLAEDRARARGLTQGLLIVNTDGSTSRVSKTRAIDTYDSGPTAGVLGASYVAKAIGAENVVTLDVGGTTTDVSFLAGAEVPVSEGTEVGEVVIPHASVSLSSFGIGGGSIIAVDSAGEISVGPRSAGAAPGPACFGLGGEWLTPTDVWLLLGYLEPGEFLGGHRKLNPEPARGVARELAGQLGTSLDDALHATKLAIRSELARHLEGWSARHPTLGSEADTCWLFSYGGGGGLLCTEAAEILGIDRVVVFPHSSVFSAFGAGLLPIAHSYQTVVSAGAGGSAVAAAVARLADNARRDLRAEGVRALDGVRATLTVGSAPRQDLTLSALLQAPEAVAPQTGPTPTAVRVALGVSVPRDVVVDMITSAEAATAQHERQVLTVDGVVSVPVLSGLGDPDAAPVHGPAFLRAPDTTIFVPGDWSVAFTPRGYGILSKERAS